MIDAEVSFTKREMGILKAALFYMSQHLDIENKIMAMVGVRPIEIQEVMSLALRVEIIYQAMPNIEAISR